MPGLVLGIHLQPRPSLRANGSRECAPDDRLREAIHFTASGGVDCFVALLSQ